MRGKINLGNDKKWKISFGARSLITSQLLDLDHCGQKFCHGDSYEFYGKKDFFVFGRSCGNHSKWMMRRMKIRFLFFFFQFGKYWVNVIRTHKPPAINKSFILRVWYASPRFWCIDLKRLGLMMNRTYIAQVKYVKQIGLFFKQKCGFFL